MNIVDLYNPYLNVPSILHTTQPFTFCCILFYFISEGNIINYLLNIAYAQTGLLSGNDLASIGGTMSTENTNKSNIKTDDDETVIGLSVPIEQTPEIKAYPPIHKHEDQKTSQHKSDSDSGAEQPDKILLEKGITLESNPKQSSILPSLLNGDKSRGVPVGDSPSSAGNSKSAKEGTNSLSSNSQSVNLNYEEVNLNEEITKGGDKQKGKTRKNSKNERSQDTPQDTLYETYKSDEEVVSPLNDFDQLLNPIDERNGNYSDSKFYSTEPDTGMHGVKLINGHLHMNNQTFSFYDPSRPHSENARMNRATARDYVFAGAFFLF